MAIVHASVHDAVNAITCDYRTYLPIGCVAWGTPDAAAIGAAHRALVGLFPHRRRRSAWRAMPRSPRTD